MLDDGGAVEWLPPSLPGMSAMERASMPQVPAFYSVNEAKKAAANRVYHDNDACPLGRDIPQNDRKLGDGRHRLCVDCRRLNNLDNLAATSSRK
jgi:hypothetical protein